MSRNPKYQKPLSEYIVDLLATNPLRYTVNTIPFQLLMDCGKQFSRNHVSVTLVRLHEEAKVLRTVGYDCYGYSHPKHGDPDKLPYEMVVPHSLYYPVADTNPTTPRFWREKNTACLSNTDLPKICRWACAAIGGSPTAVDVVRWLYVMQEFYVSVENVEKAMAQIN